MIEDALKEMSLDELIVSQGILKDFIANKKEAVKAEKTAIFLDTIEVGDEVSFTFKKEEVVGEVVKVNEKSFTAEFDWEGELKKAPINFNLFLKKE